MKPRRLIAAFLLAAAIEVREAVVVRAHRGSSNSTSAVRRFGPKHCVLIERSQSGSCTIRTDCHGQDTSSLEYAFDCWSANGDIFRHSYGRGGFGEHEQFDTEVQCAQCHPPDEPSQPVKAAKSVSVAKAALQTKAAQHPLTPLFSPSARAAGSIEATEHHKIRDEAPRVAGGLGDLATRVTKAQPEPAVSMYGPSQCVSTWRNSIGHCVLKTACQNVDISSYEFGLICTDGKGMKTRHIFGRGSFDASETFDTLAECSECLGLDDQRVAAFAAQKRHWRESAEASEVATLMEKVRSLTKGMTTMLSAVMTMRKKVQSEKKPTPAPPKDAAAATLAEWSGADASEVADSDVSTEPAVEASAPRLRTPAAAAKQVPSVAQVKRKHHHHHHHKRRRVVEQEDQDVAESGKGVEVVKQSKKEVQQKEEWPDAESDEDNAVTNGVGEPLGEDSDAEASELDVAEAGEASAGSLDDGSGSMEDAW